MAELPGSLVRPAPLPGTWAADARRLRRADGASLPDHQLRRVPVGRRAPPRPADRLPHRPAARPAVPGGRDVTAGGLGGRGSVSAATRAPRTGADRLRLG